MDAIIEKEDFDGHTTESNKSQEGPNDREKQPLSGEDLISPIPTIGVLNSFIFKFYVLIKVIFYFRRLSIFGNLL